MPELDPFNVGIGELKIDSGSSVYDFHDTAAQIRVNQALDADKERAAHAQRLATEIGADPRRVYGDYENWTTEYRARVTESLLKNDPALLRYINNEPLAASVSKDDWHKLSEYDKAISKFPWGPGSEITKPLWTMAKETLLNIDVDTPLYFMNWNAPLPAYLMMNGIGALVEWPLRVLHGLTVGIAKGAGEAWMLGPGQGDPSTAWYAEKAVGELLTWKLTDPSHIGMKLPSYRRLGEGTVTVKKEGPVWAKEYVEDFHKNMETYERIANRAWTYIRAGEDPPRGTYPKLDEVEAYVKARVSVAAYDRMVETARASETRTVLSPELFGKLTELYKKENIRLDFDTVNALYGGKVPERGDGLLGDIPGFAKQFQDSQSTGMKIQISMADWTTKVKDEVVDGLRSEVRYGPNDYTLTEAENIIIKAEADKAAAAGKPIQAVQTEVPPSETRIPEPPERTPFVVRASTLEEIGTRATKLRDELSARSTEIGEVGTGDPKLLRALETVTSDTSNPFRLSESVRWAYVNNRIDIVEHALDVADKSSAKLAARLRQEISLIDKNIDAIDAINDEMYQRPLFPGGRVPEKLNIRRVTAEEAGLGPSDYERHLFFVTDELGRRVGDLEIEMQNRGKRIWVEWIGTHGPLPPNTFGPKLIRELIYPLSIEFPQAETIAGYRVSGARQKAGAPAARRRLELKIADLLSADWTTVDPLTWESAAELLATPGWRRVGKTGYLYQPDTYTAGEKAIALVVRNTLDRLVPERSVDILGGRELRQGIGEEAPTPIRGMYSRSKDARSLISLAMNSTAPATLRHEVIHHLRRYQILRNHEWNLLEQASEKGDWIGKHRIEQRYKGASEGLKLEESIADEYAEWFTKRDSAHPMAKIFQKIVDFFNGLFADLKEFYGKDLTPNQIFLQIERGKMRRRQPGTTKDLFDYTEEFASKFDVEWPSIEADRVTFEPGAIMDKKRYARYISLIDKAKNKTLDKLFNDSAREAKKRLGEDWDRKAAMMFDEVMADIDSRPDFLLSDFFGKSLFHGQEVGFKPKINPAFLTEEERKTFPKRYQAKDGLDPDFIAGSFGYRTGRELIADFTNFETERGKTGPAEYRARTIQQTIEHRMEARYGKFEDQVLAEAREHAIGPEQYDLLNEELAEIAMRGGYELPLTKEAIKDLQYMKFLEMDMKNLSVIELTREIGRAGKAAEHAWQTKNVIEAFRQKQRQVELHALAEHASKFEKEVRDLNRTARRFYKQAVEGVPQEHTNWIRHILQRVGKPIWDPPTLDRNLAMQKGPKTLEEFARGRNTDGLPENWMEYEIEYRPNIPIYEALFDPTWTKELDKMTVGEYRAVSNSVRAILKNGIDEGKINLLGRIENFDAAMDKFVEAFEKIPGKEKVPPAGDVTKPLTKMAQKINTMKVGLLSMETIWERIDRTKGSATAGLFMRQFGFQFAEAGNNFRHLQMQYSKRLKELDGLLKNLGEKLPNDVFLDPIHGVPKELLARAAGEPGLYMQMTRRHLIGVLLNYGNASNLKKLVEGYGTTPEAIKRWVDTHATEADFKFAQGVGKIFAELQDLSDAMTLRMSNSVVRRLPLGTVDTAFGPMDGWYYPMVRDRTRSPKFQTGIEIAKPTNMPVMTAHGFEIERTKANYAVYLGIEPLAYHMSLRAQDLAFREIIRDNAKIFRDPRFRNAMTKALGQHYTELLEPYLRDLAGQRAPTAEAWQTASRVGEAIRVNTIGVLIGYNMGTVAKHSSSAFLQSFAELRNPANFLTAWVDIFRSSPDVMKSNWNFMWKGGDVGAEKFAGSKEIQTRAQHWIDTFGGALDTITGKLSLRERFLRYGAAPVAYADLAISSAMWIAKYREVFRSEVKAGKTVEEAHIEANKFAEWAVRKTHGSTAITSRPLYMRSPDTLPKTLTSLYGFFNHVYNRMYRMSWVGKELVTGKSETPLNDMRWLAWNFALYIAFPAYIEEQITPLTTSNEKSWAHNALMPLLHISGAAVPVLREGMHALFSKHDPAIGTLSGSMKMVTDAFGKGTRKGFTKENFGDQLMYMNQLAGLMFGATSVQTGRWMKGLYNYFQGYDKPRNMQERLRMIRYGTTREPRRH